MIWLGGVGAFLDLVAGMSAHTAHGRAARQGAKFVATIARGAASWGWSMAELDRPAVNQNSRRLHHGLIVGLRSCALSESTALRVYDPGGMPPHARGPSRRCGGRSSGSWRCRSGSSLGGDLRPALPGRGRAGVRQTRGQHGVHRRPRPALVRPPGLDDHLPARRHLPRVGRRRPRRPGVLVDGKVAERFVATRAPST